MFNNIIKYALSITAYLGKQELYLERRLYAKC